MHTELQALGITEEPPDEPPTSSGGQYVQRAACDYRAASRWVLRLRIGKRAGYRPEDAAPEAARLHAGRMRRLVADLLRGTVALEELREQCRILGELP